MNPSLLNEIKEHLGLYLIGQLSLSEFHDWLIPAVWDIDTEGEDVKRLAHRIQLLVAEFSNGDRDEKELRDALWEVRSSESRSVTVTVASGSLPCSLSFGYSATVNQFRVVPARAVGTGLAVACESL